VQVVEFLIHVVPQTVKNEADSLGIFKEPLWAEDGSLRYTKMKSGGIGFTGADTDDLASAAEEIGQPVECWTVDSESSTQNTREDVVVDGIKGGGQI